MLIIANMHVATCFVVSEQVLPLNLLVLSGICDSEQVCHPKLLVLP